MNLMIGTSIRGRGGISSVINQYIKDGIIQDWDFLVLESHVETGNLFKLYFVYLRCICLVIWLLVTKDVKLVHIHMASNGSFYRKSVLIRIVKMFGKGVILHLHGGGFKEFYEKSTWVLKFLIIKTLSDADRVIVLSRGWKQWVESILGSNAGVTVVYNSVCAFSSSCKVIPGHILFLGRLEESKGVADLLHSFSIIERDFPFASLTLAGVGNLEFYKKMARRLGVYDKVSFPGWVEGRRKESLLGVADIYCLPSYKEGFPVSVLEAMSSGCAVISSDVGGISDAIDHKKTGLLYEAGDVDALSYCLRLYLSNEIFVENIKKLALDKFESTFTSRSVRPALEEVYNSIFN